MGQSSTSLYIGNMIMQQSYASILLVFALAEAAHGFCAHGIGGIGEYSGDCTDSIDMEACYARCNCWTDFPDMGGQITHEIDAACFLDACWCSHNQHGCPYGTLKTNPFCCSKSGFKCNEFTCDTDGNCEHTGKKDQFL